jgi:hypothetical protein
LDRILHRSWKMAKPGRAGVRFGPPIDVQGMSVEEAAARVRKAVEEL